MELKTHILCIYVYALKKFFFVSSFLEWKKKRKQVAFLPALSSDSQLRAQGLLTTPITLVYLFITHIALLASPPNKVNHNEMK